MVTVKQDKGIAMCMLPSATLEFKYGHFWLQKNKNTCS